MKKPTERLHDMRVDHDLNQIDVATVLGISQQHYSKYETGKYELPARMFSILADYYDVSVDYLMGRIDAPESVAVLKKPFVDDKTIGAFAADVCSLSKAARRAVAEYVELQKLKEQKGRK